MKINTLKKINKVKCRLSNGWYFCMKPLAKLIMLIDKKKSEKLEEKMKNMPLEEVARLYVKYTIKKVIKIKNRTLNYYCCTKWDRDSYYYDGCFILSELYTVGYFSKTKLNNWWFYNKEYQEIGYGDESDDRWITLENKLRLLVEKEFVRIGCKVDFVDESEKLDARFVRLSGYQKTMVVTI